MTARTAWLVGSANLASIATLVVGGVNQNVAAGDYYLRDSDDDLSLIKQVENAIAVQVAGSTVTIQKDRKVHIDFNGNSTTLTIPAALQELLGFTGSPYAGATSRTAENVSSLLWSPGWPETPTGSPVGAPGRQVWDRVMTASPTGLSFDVTVLSSVTLISWAWYAVRQDRAWTASQAPGEFVVFFEDMIVAGRRFKFYSGIEEDDASTTEVTWTTTTGPYVVPEPDYDWYQRFRASSDSLGVNIEIKAMKTSEYE
jgi:hypothetical protein